MLNFREKMALKIVKNRIGDKHKDYRFNDARLCEDRDGFEIVGLHYSGTSLIKFFISSNSILRSRYAIKKPTQDQIAYFLIRNKLVKGL
jgi:hypothetical protein